MHGTGFEFLRHEALNARNFFASTDADKPEFRRNQFGGVVGGPIREDRTFFFVDYQGQRQTIGRTVISTVPTVLQRQGIFTEAIGGRVPAIYDPATTSPTGTGDDAQPFPGNTIPVDRIDPVARAPAGALSAADERRHRQQLPARRQRDASIRTSSACASITASPPSRDQVFGRLTRFSENFDPGDAAARRQRRHHRHARPAGHRRLVVRLELPAHVLRSAAERAADRRHPADGRPHGARSSATSASAASSLPGIPSTRAVPEHAADVPDRRLSAARLAAEHRHRLRAPASREVADSLTWLKGRHTFKVGADLRWERLNVMQPPSPTGSFTFSNLFTDLPGTANTGTPFASFLLGQVQQFSIDLQQDEIRNRARFQEYFVQDDWRVTDRTHRERRRCATR